MDAPVRPWLTLKQAAEYMQWSSPDALRQAVERRQIPHGRIGRAYRFKADDLDRWMTGTPGRVLMKEARKRA